MKRLIAVTAALCVSCTVKLLAANPVLLYDTVPAAWIYEPQSGATPESDGRWWKVFGDDTLSALIEGAREHSLDLRQTLRRVEMARQSWLAAKAGWSPVLDLGAGWSRQRSSGVVTPGIPAAITGYFDLGLNLSWEIDVFGRVAAQVREGKAAWQTERALYDAAMVSLSANIATAYVNLLLAQARITVANHQIESQERIHAITVARHECGLASRLDVSQSLSVLYSTRATLPSLKAGEAAAMYTIATLTGVYPDKVQYLRDKPGHLPNPFVMTDLGVPADLLRRRPDIRAAEYEVAGYAAALGIAKKAFLPTLELTGNIGTSARHADDLFSSESFTWNIAPRLSWTIFEGLARSRNIAQAKEQMLAGIDNYNLTVMNAVTETDSALESYHYALEQIGLIQKVCDESRESLSLALDRYKRGLSAFTDVMNAQLSLLQYENTLLQCKGAALNAAISVYRAVAGSPLAQ